MKNVSHTPWYINGTVNMYMSHQDIKGNNLYHMKQKANYALYLI